MWCARHVLNYKWRSKIFISRAYLGPWKCNQLFLYKSSDEFCLMSGAIRVTFKQYSDDIMRYSRELEGQGRKPSCLDSSIMRESCCSRTLCHHSNKKDKTSWYKNGPWRWPLTDLCFIIIPSLSISLVLANGLFLSLIWYQATLPHRVSF